jgi:hypothetical protein
MRTDFGIWGGHVELFEHYYGWRDYRQACIENGVNPRTGQPFEAQLLEALNTGNTALLEASPDTKADFATFLWEPIQANFYQGYDYVQAQWEKYLGIESVNTFDEVRIKGINGLSGIGYVGDLGQYPGLRRTFRPEAAIVVDIYGGIYAMSRKLLRSQGVEKITQRNPDDMGQAMADFVTQMFVALVVANPTAPDGTAMYHSSRGNTTTADISEDSIVDAAVWLRTRKDPDGRPIRSNIRSAVVQNDRPALRIRQAVNSQLTGIVDNDIPTTQMGRGTSNPLASSDLLPADGIVIDPWFPDANDVYYFGDPNRNPAFVAAFLDGQRRPLIGMEDATVMHLSISNGSGHDPYSYLRDTIDYKTRHDVGVTAVEPLSTYRQVPA